MKPGSVAARPRVMVIHHEAHFDLKVADWLAAHGYEVMMARDMGEALELLHDNRPDGIVLDLQLRALSGMEALRIVKSIYPVIPIITITESPLNDLAHLSITAGACASLIKPFEFQHLRNLLDAHMRNPGAQEHQPGAPQQARTALARREGVPIGEQAGRQ